MVDPATLPESGITNLSVTDDIDVTVRRAKVVEHVPELPERNKPRRPVIPGVWPDNTREDKPRPTIPAFMPQQRHTVQAQTTIGLTDTVKVDKHKPPLKPIEPPNQPINCEDAQNLRRLGIPVKIPPECSDGHNIKITTKRGNGRR